MSQYPTGPAVTIDPIVTSFDHPALLALYSYWFATGAIAVAFVLYRVRRAWKGDPHAGKSPGSSTSPGSEDGAGGFGRAQGDSKANLPHPAASAVLDDGQPSPVQTSPATGRCSPVSVSGSSSPRKSECRLDMPKHPSVKTVYYANDKFGGAVFVMIMVFMVHLYGLFIVLLMDQYWGCQFQHIDNMCFRGSHPIFGSYTINSYIFISLWHAILISYGIGLANKARMRNWFRIPCRPGDAQHIWIWTRVVEEIRVDENQMSPAVRAVKKVTETFWKGSVASHEDTVEVFKTEAGSRCYEFQGSRFVYSQSSGTFESYAFQMGSTLSELHQHSSGIDGTEAKARLDLVGKNEIPYRLDSTGALMRREFFSYFYIYQLLMYMNWFWYSYIVTGCLVFSVAILSGFLKVGIMRRTQLSLKKLTDYVTPVLVKRAGQWSEAQSLDLVPGDVIQLRGDWVLPCDAVLLAGAAVCNESTLTGEPMPLQKVQAPPDDTREYSPKGRGSRYTLFAGTTVLQAGRGDEEVEAVVTGTGMNTSKGEILSAILFPSRLTFKYTAELPVVIFILFCYAMVNFASSFYLVLNNGTTTLTWVTYWCSALFTISQVLSPLLPVALVAGQIKATSRLKDKGIFCLNPAHIPICGKIRVFCFDKTGTLTREGLDFLGFWPVSEAAEGRANLSGGLVGQKQGRAGAWGTEGLHALASCHSVSEYNDTFVGNQLEVAMLKATGWDLSEGEHQRAVVSSPDKAEHVTTIRRFEFDHARQTMSVVVRYADGTAHAFLKGSFERVGQLADEESLPNNYMDAAKGLALDGCYVLAVAYHNLGKVPDDELVHMTRDQAENGGRFIGLMAFRNELKPDSAQAIAALRRGAVRTVMITGDNAMTGLYIGKSVGMLQPKSKVLLAEKPPAMVNERGAMVKSTSNSPVRWKALEKGATSSGESYSTEQLLEGRLAEQLRNGELELAVSGTAFDALEATGDMESLLLYTRIFARVSPERKVDIVRMHQAKGLVVGMCGDGGNDCGALRVAHSGIALSDAEASVVSSFTSKAKSCMSVVDLLLEGRTALHSSLAAYKFLITYGQLFSLMKVVMFYSAVVPSRLFYFSTDVIAVLFMTWAMNFSMPRKHLAPERPTSSLLGANTLASILGLHIINAVTFTSVALMVFSHPDYVPWPRHFVLWKENWLHADNWEATAISFPMYILFISSGVTFSFGHKFRRPVYTNLPLMAVYGLLMGMQAFLLLSDPNMVTRWWHVASEAFNRPGTTVKTWSLYQATGGQPSPGMPFELRAAILALSLLGAAVGAIWQTVGVNGLGRRVMSRFCPGGRPDLLL